MGRVQNVDSTKVPLCRKCLGYSERQHFSGHRGNVLDRVRSRHPCIKPEVTVKTIVGPNRFQKLTGGPILKDFATSHVSVNLLIRATLQNLSE